VRALREIARAEVLLYDALIDPGILELAPAGCERIDVGKRGDGSRGVPQDRIAELMIARAREGRYVVRLKGGDPFVFGRGGEEASALAEAGVAFEVVPGVTSALAVPAYAGIPVTDRRHSSSLVVVTGHRGKSAVDTRIRWEELARSAETLVVLMGTAWLDDIAERLVAGGRDPETPVAVIERGTTPRQRVVTAPLREIARRTREAGLRAPTVVVVGEVVRLRDALQWYERRPLFGKRVLVTREAEQGRALARLLRERGAEPVHVPLLAFAPPHDPGPLDRALEKLDRYQWMVLSSANAARAVAQRLEASGLRGGGPWGPRVACIGPSTAEVARAAGIPVDAAPRRGYPPAEVAREMAIRSPLAGARVLLPRARDARHELVAALLAEGAVVEAVEAYRTERPEAACEALRAAVDEGLDAVTLMSPSAVRHLAECVPPGSLASLASRAVFACIGPTTASALRGKGIEPQLVCAEAAAGALVEALEEHYGRLAHGVSA
jgi:uroporphyrinogen III methyltransferase/synthase